MKDLVAKKSLGQNFLKDENILKKISDSIIIHPEDLVLEIGPGMGALTKYLLEKDCYYIGYEIDERTKSFLLPMLHKKASILYEDFLKASVIKDIEQIPYKHLYLLANIPYYITNPIVMKIVLSHLPIEEMTLLVQKEVASRFSAKSGTKEYNALSLYLQYYFTIDKICDVSPLCFTPVPKVDSAVVHFKRREVLPPVAPEVYFPLLRAAFSQKRKTLKNNLKNYDWEKIWEILRLNGFSESVRAEEIPMEVFLQIAKKISE